MKKNLLLIIVFTAFSVSLFSQKINIGETEYTATVLTPRTEVTSGVWKYSYGIAERAVRIYVIESDLKQPDLKFEVCLAHDSIYYAESLISMYNRKNSVDHRVVGMINGDFFIMGDGLHTEGDPKNGVMIDGQIARTPNTAFGPMMGFDEQNVPYFGNVTYSGLVKEGSYFTRSITKINAGRSVNDLVLYNSMFGPYTKTNAYGSEVKLKLSTGQSWRVGTPVKCKVIEIRNGQGNSSIARDEVVLSAHGSAVDIIDRLSVGKEVTFNLSMQMDGITGNSFFRYMFGSNTLVLNDGEIVDVSKVTSGSATSNAVRSVVGHNSDKTKFYMVLVEGNGLKTSELSLLMKSLGAATAMNCDGGGSSGLYVDGSKFNTYYAGRRVANALMLVKTPTGDVSRSSEDRNFTIVTHTDGSFSVILPRQEIVCEVTLIDLITSIRHPLTQLAENLYSTEAPGFYLIQAKSRSGNYYTTKWNK